MTSLNGRWVLRPDTDYRRRDIVKLARLTNNFNLLNLVISDEPGSGPVPPPTPVTRDTSGDVAAGAPVVSGSAEKVPAAVQDISGTVAAGAPRGAHVAGQRKSRLTSLPSTTSPATVTAGARGVSQVTAEVVDGWILRHRRHHRGGCASARLHGL